MILLGYALSIGYIVLAFLITWLCKKLFSIQEETSRKLIHISIGFMWPIMYYTLKGTIHFFAIPLAVFILFFAVSKTKLFSIITREKGDSLFGIILYIISIVIMSLISFFLPDTLVAYGLAVFALTFGDGFAALFGKRFGKYTPKLFGDKSLAGSLACIVFAFIGMTLVSLLIGYPINIPKFLLLSFATAILEIYSGKWDNLSIPLTIMTLGYFLNV